MKPEDLADASARALELLPPGDPARSDPRFARDPRLAEEARLTREAAAEVWLAVSPLHSAPSDVLQAVMDEVRPAAAGESGKTRWLPWIAASGWAAAIVAVALWPKTESAKPPAVVETPAIFQAAPRPRISARSEAPATGVTREVRMRREIVRLQERLAAKSGSISAPRVISLHAPGAPQRTPAEARQRVQSILLGALRSAMEAETGAPDDPASLVIERGWLPGNFADGEEIVRHRHFPEASWQELGLRRAADGAYFDPASGLLWVPDPEGRGFIGRKSDPPPALPEPPAIADFPVLEAPRTAPEGFIVEDPETNTAEVVIDQVPPPAEGAQHLVVVTDGAGNTETIPLDELAGNFGAVGNMSFGGTFVIGIPNIGAIADFQLIERQFVSNGTPDRVIVGSGP